MLTGDLVRVRLRAGVLRPAFVDPDAPRLRSRAEELIDAFTAHVGRRREELDEAIGVIAGDGTDHKLTRGLAKVLADHASFDVNAPLPPAELRARVFREAARRGPLGERAVEGGRPTATAIWEALGAELGHATGVLAEALYADHPDQQVLLAVAEWTPEALLHRYNLALAQSVLLRCAELRLKLLRPAPARVRQVLRSLKFHQLLFAVTRTDDGLLVTVDGPTSLFSQTTRYGMALARALPALIHAEAWSLDADVRWTRGLARLSLEAADGLRSHARDVGAYETRESRWFEERFLALESGWELTRDPEPVAQGPSLVVPDFTFRKDGRVAHLEILGFWRKGTIPARLAATRAHGPPNLILAVSRRMCADDADALPDQVIPFGEVIPAKEVLRRVEAMAVRDDGAR